MQSSGSPQIVACQPHSIHGIIEGLKAKHLKMLGIEALGHE